MPYFPVEWQKESLVSPAHTVEFVLHKRNSKIITLRTYLEWPSQLPILPEMERSLLWNVNKSGWGGLWWKEEEALCIAWWNENKWLQRAIRLLSLQKSLSLALLFNHTLTQVARVFFSESPNHAEMWKYLWRVVSWPKRWVGWWVKFTYELYIGWKYWMNVKFPEIGNYIIIYSKISFFLGDKCWNI